MLLVCAPFSNVDTRIGIQLDSQSCNQDRKRNVRRERKVRRKQERQEGGKGKQTIELVTMQFTLIAVSVWPSKEPVALLVAALPFTLVRAAVGVIVEALAVHQAVLPFSRERVAALPLEGAALSLVQRELSDELASCFRQKSAQSAERTRRADEREEDGGRGRV